MVKGHYKPKEDKKEKGHYKPKGEKEEKGHYKPKVDKPMKEEREKKPRGPSGYNVFVREQGVSFKTQALLGKH